MEAFRNFVSYGIAEWAYACAGGGPSTAFHQYNSINRDTWEKEVSGISSFFSNSKKKDPKMARRFITSSSVRKKGTDSIRRYRYPNS